MGNFCGFCLFICLFVLSDGSAESGSGNIIDFERTLIKIGLSIPDTHCPVYATERYTPEGFFSYALLSNT